MTDTTQHETWSSRSAFLLATVGAAVGLGNLWRFPFVAGQNGGGAFVLVYLGFIILLCVPIVMAELAIGRRGQKSPVSTIKNLCESEGRSNKWQIIGWLSIIVPMLGLSYYAVVAGWAIEYVFEAAKNSFSGYSGSDSEGAFNTMLSSPIRMLITHTLFIAASVFVVSRGVHGGIEKASKIMMPMLFILLLVMVGYAIVAADFKAGFNFLFAVDFSKMTPKVVFMALGQAFFSVAIGVGVLMTYGSYIPKSFSLPVSAVTIVCADTMVAILAGLAIFPLVFQYGLNPSGGPGLIFITLPIAFGAMTAGHIVGLVFFVLLFFAAFSTAIGMLEPVVSWFQDKGYKRPITAVFCGATAWLLGIAALLSYNVWQDVRLLSMIPLVSEKSIFDLMDFIVSNLLLPLNGLLIAIFAGWVMSSNSIREELGIKTGWLFSYWRIVIKFVAPIAIAFIMITSLQ